MDHRVEILYSNWCGTGSRRSGIWAMPRPSRTANDGGRRWGKCRASLLFALVA